MIINDSFCVNNDFFISNLIIDHQSIKFNLILVLYY
jgi:hypothetical protein